jgi:hypothetical protein
MIEEKLIEYAGYEPVVGTAGCVGCAFKNQPVYDSEGELTDCGKVACFHDEFPEGHPLSNQRSIIWKRKEADDSRQPCSS